MPNAYRGRHRRRSAALTTTALAATGTAIAVGVPGLAGVANAATSADWTRLAQCESGGNWHINTGNGFYGGLQFTESTWAGFGGTAYAARADLATPTQQMAIANRVLAQQGWNAWPSCSRQVGLYGTSTSGGATTAPSTTSTTTTRSVPAQASRSTSRTPLPAAHTTTTASHTYVVRSGDTLGAIASRYHVAGGWQALFTDNRQVIGSNPNLIFPGQRLALS